MRLAGVPGCGEPNRLDQSARSDHDRWVPARVALLGFPGMEPDLLDRYMAEGTAPAFAELARSGRILDLENRLDHLPDVVWPEIFTGRNGADLGWYRLPAQLFSGETRPRAVDPGDFDLTAFWDHAGRAGRRVAVVDVPYSGPSPDANGLVVRGWGTHDKPFGTASDPDSAIIDGLLAKHGPHPVGHIHAEHTRCDDHDDSVESLRALRDNLLAGADLKAALFQDVLQEDWDLFAGAFEEAHCAGHQFWHLHDPSSPWHDPGSPQDLQDTMRSVHASLDRALGDVLESLGSDTTVLVALSHGMHTSGAGWQLLPDFLVRVGYGSGSTAAGRARSRLPAPVKAVARTLLRGRARQTLQRAAGSLPEPLGSSETRAVALMNSPCGAIRLNVVGRDPFGAIEPGAEYEAACAELTEELHALVDDRTGKPAVRQVMSARQHYGDKLHPNIPDLLIEFETDDGPVETVHSLRIGTISVPVRTPALPRTGDHTNHSRLFVAGPGIAPGLPADEGNVVDIAATILRLLDVEVPAAYNGRPLDLGAPAPLGEPAA
jgi:predicted AlkP superfamily phosphohydrolase/phosphomutase